MGRIFGPVASRRLGRSLGIDVIPYKTCSFDCVYCECGRTTDLTVERAEFYPPGLILDELRQRLSGIQGGLDVLTLSGAGEPTLYSAMGELISGIKEMSSVPVAVITNGSLLGLREVREELALADIVVPSLDAALLPAFRRINRPHPALDLGEIMNGIKAFSLEYSGEIRFEILLLDGYNTGSGELEALRTFLSGLEVGSIQLNTAVRPGTVEDVKPLSAARMEELREYFGPRCEIVASFSARAAHEEEAAATHILSMIERRPCTAADIGAAL
ncbi:MAG TPA: radical SAM protein, partial [Candidatus Krumholzibacterium sp.]|nr:radical SAM protein [Candidatus Krumholzibacterium sp.]